MPTLETLAAVCEDMLSYRGHSSIGQSIGIAEGCEFKPRCPYDFSLLQYS